MSRIRTVKPEFWASEQIMEMSRDARLGFIGLWNFCDDAGTHPASVRTLKAEVFPCDDIDVGALVAEWIARGLVVEYQAAGKPFWRVTGWHHQKIDRPNYKHPMPNGEIPAAGVKYEAIRRVFDELSTNARRALTPGREGSLKESIGGESKGDEGRGLGRDLEPPPPPPEGEPLFFLSDKIQNLDPAQVVFIQDADDGGVFKITVGDLLELQSEYPNVDVKTELRTTIKEVFEKKPEYRTTESEIQDQLNQILFRMEENNRPQF